MAYIDKKMTRLVTLMFLFFGQVCLGQINSSDIERTDKLVYLIDKEINSMYQIAIYFIFDTDKEGQVMVKNSYLDIDLNCKGRYNDEGKVYFYFNKDSLKLIRHFDYDPIEGSSSREINYYFAKNKLIFIKDYHEESRTWNATAVANSITRSESKIYMDNKTVIKYLSKSRDGLDNLVEKDNFQKIPYSETNTFDDYLIQNMNQLLNIIRKGWITTDKVKIQ
jgi:hypothetical protein